MELNSSIAGIDLGTTNSEIYLVRDGKPEPCIGPNQTTVTPSTVTVDTKSQKNNIKFAKGAVGKNIAKKFPQNFIYEPKRLIGRKFNDDFVRRDIYYWPFTVVEGEDGLPNYYVKGKDDNCCCTAVDVDAEILRVLKSYLKKEDVSRAVITVPSYFTKDQIEATKKAGEQAGFTVEDILPEPISAAIAYGYKYQVRNHTILVYDLGGGTFDCCLIKVENGKYITLAYDGFSHLGGADFDNEIVGYFCDEYKKEHGYDLFESKKDIKGLKTMAENLKIALSDTQQDSYPVIYEPIGLNVEDPPHINKNFTRAEFEGLIQEKYIQKTIDCIQRIINQTNLTINNIDDIVCVGGSTRIPLVQRMISEFFGNRTIDFNAVKYDEAVAEGAAIYAAYLEKGIHLLEKESLENAKPNQELFEEKVILTSIPYNIYINEGLGYTHIFQKGKEFGNCTFIKRIRNYENMFDHMKYYTVDLFLNEKEDEEKHFFGRCKLEIMDPYEKKKSNMSIFVKYENTGMIECHLENNCKDKCSKIFTLKTNSDGTIVQDSEMVMYAYEQEAKKLLRSTFEQGNTPEVAEKRKNILEFLQYLAEDGMTDDLEDIQENYEELIKPLLKSCVCYKQSIRRITSSS